MKTDNWWSRHRFGCVSLTISLVELAIFGSLVMLARLSPGSLHPTLVARLGAVSWVLGFLGSFGFAVAGVITDTRKLTALISVIISLGTLAICTLTMLS